MNIFSLLAVIVFLGGLIFVLKKGFNELISGLQSIDNRLKRIEENLDNKNKQKHNRYKKIGG